jgi:hypothetical protein
MQLQEFVRDTIRQIVLGMKGAGDELAREGVPCALNPIWKDEILGQVNVLQIDFDVAVTVVEGSQAEAGGGLKVGIQVVSLDIGGKGRTSSETSSVSRVKFSVPYIPPSTTVDRLQGRQTAKQTFAQTDYDPFENGR